MKIKKGSLALYAVALMLVTAGYWSYISNESKVLETVSSANQGVNTTNSTENTVTE